MEHPLANDLLLDEVGRVEPPDFHPPLLEDEIVARVEVASDAVAVVRLDAIEPDASAAELGVELSGDGPQPRDHPVDVLPEDDVVARALQLSRRDRLQERERLVQLGLLDGSLQQMERATFDEEGALSPVVPKELLATDSREREAHRKASSYVVVNRANPFLACAASR
ncbi:hypothetical protein WMF27_02905 [Sorangium sp. So ce281]|uniref:hypothetical protein n=1 Tax=Sorangium sp. So ce281 TaxID=3133293 RepID=UPI003F5DFF3E